MFTRAYRSEDFACKCGCGTNEIKADIIERLQILTDMLGFRLRWTSGYRCSRHPAELAKLRPGTHNLGLAVDVYHASLTVRKIYGTAEQSGLFKGIGVDAENRYIDVDIAGNKPRRRWAYSSGQEVTWDGVDWSKVPGWPPKKKDVSA